MKMPGTDQLNIAIAWLRKNEGDGAEADACAAIADWIEHEERERFIRREARRAGITAARVRRKLAEQSTRY